MHALEVARKEAARKHKLLHEVVQDISGRTQMPRPVHVSVMLLLREIGQAGVAEEAVIVELQSDAFDQTLQHLQSQPGRANQPTDVGDNSFKFGDVEVRRI